MNGVVRLNVALAAAGVLVLIVAVAFGETGLSADQWRQAFTDPASGPGDVLWRIRAPRAACAFAVGAALAEGDGLVGSAAAGGWRPAPPSAWLLPAGEGVLAAARATLEARLQDRIRKALAPTSRPAVAATA
jgi:iron complex transport system permease protein